MLQRGVVSAVRIAGPSGVVQHTPVERYAGFNSCTNNNVALANSSQLRLLPETCSATDNLPYMNTPLLARWERELTLLRDRKASPRPNS